MGKSLKKTPALKIASDSDKSGTKEAHKQFRRVTKRKLTKYIANEMFSADLELEDDYPDANKVALPYKLEEVADIWNYPSDGGPIYVSKLPKKYLRK